MGFSHIAVTTEVDPKVIAEKHPVSVIVLLKATVIVTFGRMLVGGRRKRWFVSGGSLGDIRLCWLKLGSQVL